MSPILNLISFGREVKTCSRLPANCTVKEVIVIVNRHSRRPQAQHFGRIFLKLQMERSGRVSRWLPARPRVLTPGSTLQLSPPSVLSPFINSPHFWDNSCRVLNSARQLLSRLRALCVLIRSAITLRCILYRLQDPQSDFVFFMCTCVFLSHIHRPEPALRSFGR